MYSYKNDSNSQADTSPRITTEEAITPPVESPHTNIVVFREAKFKRALRVHFLTHFTKNFCRFLTPKVISGTDMINPSIESSDFLFGHENIWSQIFENFVVNRQSTFHEFKFSVCLHTL